MNGSGSIIMNEYILQLFYVRNFVRFWPPLAFFVDSGTLDILCDKYLIITLLSVDVSTKFDYAGVRRFRT